MVERPIKKSERQAMAKPQEQESNSAPTEAGREFTQRTERRGRRKGKDKDRGDRGERATPANPALMRGPKPVRTPLVSEEPALEPEVTESEPETLAPDPAPEVVTSDA